MSERQATVEDFNWCQCMRLRKNRRTERAGVNAARAFFEGCDCVFQEVDLGNDYGKDAYLDLVEGQEVTGACVALQIKTGVSYRRASGYVIPIEGHAEVWRRSTLPVAGIVYDPELEALFWCDISSFLTEHPDDLPTEIPVAQSNVLTRETLETVFKPTFRRDQRLTETVQSDQGPSVFRFPGRTARPQDLLRYKDLIIVGNWDVGNLSFVDPAKRSIEAIIPLDRYECELNPTKTREIRVYEPGPLAVAGGKLFLGQIFSDNVLVIDLATRSIVKRIQMPGGGEGSIAASPDSRTVYFASNKDNALFSIDTTTYALQRFPYPNGGRGSMCVACSADNSRVYVGIQRGYRATSGELPGGGCFLTVFDPHRCVFTQTLPLFDVADGRPDASSPAYILPDANGERVYVGMFQSCAGIYLLDSDPLRVLRCSSPSPNAWNRHFEWVDPISLQFFRDDLLALHRNNLELVLLDRETLAIKQRAFLGEAPNGPRNLLVLGDQAIITYPEKGGLLFLDLNAAELWK